MHGPYIVKYRFTFVEVLDMPFPVFLEVFECS